MDDSSNSTEGDALTAEKAWTILLALSTRAKADNAICSTTAIAFHDDEVEFDGARPALLFIDLEAPRSWSWGPAAEKSADLAELFDLYIPLCVGPLANTMVIAHLGQSLDGRIATEAGVSQFITGHENIVHTHRLRALFDVVLVGASTASTDNPKLTTRHVDGDHATRVLLDPHCTVDPEASIFTDGQARTLVICDSAFAPANHAQTHIALPAKDGIIEPSAIITALRMLGLKRIFVEGGGVTISRFLEAGELHRLHLCVAPMIIGSGRPAFRLPEAETLEECVYLDVQHFKSGRDLLFDCQLRSSEK